jgi:hypothetical protein
MSGANSAIAAVIFSIIAASISKFAHAESPGTVKFGDLELSSYWIRAMAPGDSTATAYLVIKNTGTVKECLIAASTSSSGWTEFHEMRIVAGTTRMRRLMNGIAIEPGQTVEFKPDGHHIVFNDVEVPIENGSIVSVMLTFDKAGKVHLMVPVIASRTGILDHDTEQHRTVVK